MLTKSSAKQFVLHWVVSVTVLIAITGTSLGQGVDESLKRATDYLISQQDDRGAVSEKKQYERNQNAMTALAILALSSQGHQASDKTPEGRAIRRALEDRPAAA